MRSTHAGLALLLASGCSSSTDKVATTLGGNLAPTVDTVTLGPEPAYETSVLTCQPGGTNDADGDDVTLSYAWTVNGAAITPNGQTLNGNDFNKNDQVSCTVTPSDGLLDGTPVSSNIVTISNTPPRGTNVEIDPDPATAADTLSANALGWSDIDGDTEFWRYAWFVNGVDAGVTNDEFSGGFVKGDDVYVVATPDDGDDQGDPLQSPTVTIANTPPTVASASITPISPKVTDILTCTPAGPNDADGDPVTYGYQWYVNGAAAGTGTELLAAPNFRRGDSVWCVVTPTDGEDDGPSVQSNTVTIVNAPPTIASVSLSPNPAYETSVLTCAPAGMADADGDIVTLQFTWTVGGLPILASTSTLTGTDFNKGQAVQCTVIPNDGITVGTPVASNVVIISNSAPSATSVAITPTTPDTNTTLTASASGWSDADGDPAAYRYQWYKNGVILGGETTSQLLGTQFVKHDLISVSATPDDGTALGAPVFSTDVEILNSPPGAPLVAITPKPADNNSNLVCNIALGSMDADGDSPITYSYTWLRNGIDQGITVNNVDNTRTANGDTWTCLVTPDDGEDFGTAGSDLVSISDTTPPNAPTLNAIDALRNDTLVPLSGTAEALTTITLYATCTMGSSGNGVTAAGPTGLFAINWNMQFGEYCDFYVTAMDAAFNVSPPSNTVFTTVCGTPDPYEGGGYGDTNTDPIDEWAPLPDTGVGAIVITGNILPGDVGDWYVVYSSDNLVADQAASQDLYDFRVHLTGGAGIYTFKVYKNDVGASDLECTGLANGYDDYNDYVLDQGEGHAVPANPQSCKATNQAGYNICEDNTRPYYIKVIRDPAVAASCDPYTITVTNNAP